MLQGQAHMSPFYGDLSNLPHLHGLFFLLRPSKQCLTSIRACTSSPVLIHLCLPRVEKQVVYLSMSNGCRDLLLLLHHYSFPFLSCWHPPPPPRGRFSQNLIKGLPWSWGSSGWESTCRCRGLGFDRWFGRFHLPWGS